MRILKQGLVAAAVTAAGLFAYHVSFAPTERLDRLEDRVRANEKLADAGSFRVSAGAGVRLRVKPLGQTPLSSDFGDAGAEGR